MCTLLEVKFLEKVAVKKLALTTSMEYEFLIFDGQHIGASGSVEHLLIDFMALNYK